MLEKKASSVPHYRKESVNKMIPAYTYSDILQQLNNDLEDAQDKVQLVGLIFSRPPSEIAKDHIIPSLRYFHIRSGQNVSFFFAGFRPDDTVRNVHEYQIPGPNGYWIFDEIHFNQLRSEIEQLTAWRYSGGNDFILATGRYNKSKRRTYIDFTDAIVINLEKLLKDNSLPTIAMLFEKIFSFAEDADPNHPIWDFSDKMGLSLGRGAIKGLILSLLPESVRSHFKSAFHYAVQNITPEDIVKH